MKKLVFKEKKKLPNETGGILIGSFDMERKKLFILDTIIPKDNLEFPASFFRGIDGLKDELSRIKKITANMLTYVGEWHSHPNNCSIKPSEADLELLSWLSNNMSVEGLPAIMLILGENQKHTIKIKI